MDLARCLVQHEFHKYVIYGVRLTAADLPDLPILGNSPAAASFLDGVMHEDAQTDRYDHRSGQLGMVVDELELRRAQLEAENAKLKRALAAADNERGRSAELLAVVAEAGRVIASAWHPLAGIGEIAARLVPALADVCIADLASEDGTLQRIAVAAADPRKQHLVRAARLVRPGQDAGSALEAAFALDRPLLVSSFSARGRDDSGLRHERFVHACAPRSVLYVPMVAYGQPLGAFTFLLAESGRSFGAAELAAAEQLARQVAMAAESARLFEHARRAEHARSQLLECVGRDLARPMTGLLAGVEGLVDNLPGRRGAAGRRRVESIRRGLQRTRRLLDDLVDVAHIDSGQFTIDSAEAELPAIVDEAVSPHRSLAQEKAIALEIDLPRGARRVRCDRARAVQVFHNLIDNALRFTPSGGRVRITAERNGETIVAAVQDSGPGIPVQQIPRLFQRGAAPEGTAGLGLFIARSIIEAHGGVIWVDLAVKPGARFCFTLPAA